VGVVVLLATKAAVAFTVEKRRSPNYRINARKLPRKLPKRKKNFIEVGNFFRMEAAHP